MKLRFALFILLFSGALSSQEQFNLQGGTFHTGSVMRRYDILFDLAKPTLRPEAPVVLDSIAAFLVQHPEFSIEIGYHHQPVSAAYSFNPYYGRAEAVRDVLVTKGVRVARLTTVLYGPKLPLISQMTIDAATDKNEKARLTMLNHRVEFKITAIDPRLIPLFTLSDSVVFPGQVLRKYNILYDLDKATLRPETRLVVDSIALFLLRHPNVSIEVGTFTDTRGSDTYNMKLSQARASNLKQYLEQEGVPAEQVTAYGYGETQQLVDSATIRKMATKMEQEEAYRLSRRTEFKITSVSRKFSPPPPRVFFTLTNTQFETGAIFSTKRIVFDSAKASIRPESFPALDSMFVFLLRHPELTVMIGDHSGNPGNYSYRGDYVLSQQRADSIMAYLVRNGIPARQLRARGFAMDQPLVLRPVVEEMKWKNPQAKPQPDLYELNRRVEFRIVQPTTQISPDRFALTDTDVLSGRIIASSIRFTLNKDSILPVCYPFLDSVVTFLQNNPRVVMEIGVHLDCRASDKYSTHLSMNRAIAIANYLIAKGIPRERLLAKGYEGSQPRRMDDGTVLTEKYILSKPTKEEQEALHQKNRRTEFRIITVN